MDTIFFIIELVGVVSFAISGAFVAIDKETDIFGVVFLALITTFGGGIMRDVILGQIPLFFTSMQLLIITCVVTSLVVFFLAMIFKRHYVKEERLVAKVNDFIDAAGISVFAVSGVRIALDVCPENGAFIAIVIGMISAIGGGMIRDMTLREIPFVLCKRVYAVATLLGSAAYYFSSVYLFASMPMGEVLAELIGFGICFLVRIFAIIFKWDMPKAINFKKMNEEIEKECEVEE